LRPITRGGNITKPATQRLIVVSNRLPHLLEKQDGGWVLKPGSGGLVTALLPVLRDRGGVWIGWPGVTDEVPNVREVLQGVSGGTGYTFEPVLLSQDEIDKYYHGYSNETIWPLFHDLQSQANFDPAYWPVYVEVNAKFGRALAATAHYGDFVWIHDYQLMDVARHAREAGCASDLAFFLHIPFPSPDIFLKLPERLKVLQSLLAYDLVGFQTMRDRRNFVQCVRLLIRNARVGGQGNLQTIRVGEREMRVGNFPIGIDAAGYAARAKAPEVKARVDQMHARYGPRQMVLGVDRLDYTKGVPQRLAAFANLLERYPDLQGRISLFQVVVPSRVGIASYDELKAEIDRMVGEINGRYSQLGWAPIHYYYRNLPPTDLLAFYRAADIALITPLKDGMNLVAKEFCACSLEEHSVLILSQFAGAAAQLGRAALVVNPYDVEQTADALHDAFHMRAAERRYRMKRLRRNVREQNIFWWVDSFIRAATHRELDDFPVLEEYIPEHHMD
jgi:trehalose 6-phosphate synthase/phosphatase